MRRSQCPDSPIGTVPAALELVEDAVIFVEGAELAAQVLVDLFGTFRLVLETQKQKNRGKEGYLREVDPHTWYVSTGLFSMLRSQTLTER